MKELLRKLGSTLAISRQLPSRPPRGELTHGDSDYFISQLRVALHGHTADQPIDSGLPIQVLRAFGNRLTVLDVLETDLATLAARTGLDIKEAMQVRRTALEHVTPAVGTQIGRSLAGEERT